MSAFRIVVADDHVFVRRGIRTLLESRGWNVLAEASTGREAIERVEELKPDIVVLDISMPDLNGLDATPQILKIAPQTRVLILTMHNTQEVMERVLKAGARGCILKSDAERDLLTAVEALMNNQTFYTSMLSEIMLDNFLHKGERPIEEKSVDEQLTSREREILQLLVEGKSNKEVASKLEISTRTVESHRANIIRKLHCHSFSDLVRYAIRNKIVET
ncbi:MAG: DNA-binding response regulator [Acidobacteria bacterium]|nr:MAG: DNA-binding response regulator [Acidobacteriota bacterium]